MSWAPTAVALWVVAAVAAWSNGAPEISEEDIAAMVSYRHLLAEIEPEVWPGWGEPVPPLGQRRARVR